MQTTKSSNGIHLGKRSWSLHTQSLSAAEHSKWLSFSNISIDPLKFSPTYPNLITLCTHWTLSSLKITKKNKFRPSNSTISLIIKLCSKFCNVWGDHLETLSYKWHDEHSVLQNAHSYFCKFFFDYVWFCFEKVLISIILHSSTVTLHVTFFLHIRSLSILVHNINMTLACVVSHTNNNISNPSQKKEIMIFK
jgi:hypothetical protein